MPRNRHNKNIPTSENVKTTRKNLGNDEMNHLEPSTSKGLHDSIMTNDNHVDNEFTQKNSMALTHKNNLWIIILPVP